MKDAQVKYQAALTDLPMKETSFGVGIVQYFLSIPSLLQ